MLWLQACCILLVSKVIEWLLVSRNAIKNTVTVSKNECWCGAEILMSIDENLPVIYCFPVRLNQVFLNFLVNAA